MDEAKIVGTLRKGSRVRYWQPNGVPEGIVEVHPDFPPRIHYFDGRPTEEFKPVKVPVMVPQRKRY